MHGPVETLLIEMKSQDAVVAGRGQIQGTLPDCDLVAVFEERAAPGIDELEVGRIGK